MITSLIPRLDFSRMERYRLVSLLLPHQRGNHFKRAWRCCKTPIAELVAITMSPTRTDQSTSKNGKPSTTAVVGGAVLTNRNLKMTSRTYLSRLIAIGHVIWRVES